MSGSTIIIVILMVVYALAVLGIGQYANKKTGLGRSEYYVAGGGLGTITIFFTYLATYISTYGFIGLSAVYFSWGLEWLWFESMFYPTLIVPLTIFFGLRFYKLGKMHGYVTNADLIAHRLDSEGPVRVWVGLVMIVFPSIFYVGIQLIAMGAILSGLTGGEISHTFVVLFFAVVMVAYIILGGMRSVAYTDVFQGITMLLIIAVSIALVYANFGGFGEMFRLAGASEHAWIFERTLPPQYFYPALIMVGIVWGGLIPHLWVRFYAANSIKGVYAAGTAAGVGGALMYALMPLIIGTALAAYYPSVPEVAVTEQFVSMMFSDWMGPVLTAVLMFGLVAAGKSTADAILLNLSSILQVDILEKTLKVDWPEKRLDLAARLMCVAVIALASIGAFAPGLPIVSVAITLIWSSYSVLLIPVVIMLFWKRANKYGAMTGLVSGFVSLILFLYVIWPEWPHNPFYLWEGTLPVAIGIVTMVVVSLLTPAPSKEVLDSFYGKEGA